MTEFGYGEDIYKLALLSNRQKDELIEKLHALPGHKSKFLEFFKVIEHLYPRNAIQKTLEHAQQKQPETSSEIKQQSQQLR